MRATEGGLRLDGPGLDLGDAPDPTRLSSDAIERLRRRRRHPRWTQFDYLHLRSLIETLAAAFARIDGAPEVLDVFCGTRPYEDLLPPASRCTGFDIDGRFGMADVVSNEFLPFPDESFDLIVCTEAFYYVTDPPNGIREFQRVLRPGGRLIMTVPLVWEYDRTILEHRYTGPQLAALFEGWEDVEVTENGGYAISWATLTGRIVALIQRRLPRFLGLRHLLRPVFALAYLTINGVGAILVRAEPRFGQDPHVLPMNLLLEARRP